VKYSLTCAVDSRASLEKAFCCVSGAFQYEFIPGIKKTLEKIRITSQVSAPKAFQSKIESGEPGGPKIHLKVARDWQLHGEMLLQFQKLESLLAFNGEIVERIRWDQPKEEVICETEEERAATEIFAVHMTEEYDRVPVRINQLGVERIIVAKDRFDSLIVPMAFWREGLNDHHSFRYINAFFNFYFILEGLYGAGKTRNSDVEKQFAKSPEFRKDIEDQIKRYREDRNPLHLECVQKMLGARSKQLDVEGVIHLLVKTRGELHHFTNNPNRPQGNPFTNKAYQSLAHMTLVLSYYAIQRQTVLINQKEAGA